MQLSVSLVSYNTKELLRRCLWSIFKYTKGLSFEVIVVDNASSDGSAEMVKDGFPRVKLIKNKLNRWYTGANNQTLRQARGKYFMILNSDIYLKSNAFKLMVDYLSKNQAVGAVEPLQFYETGRVAQTSSRHNRFWGDLIELTLLHRLIKPKWLNRLHLKGINRKKTYPAEVISDAALMLPAKLWRQLKGYDTKFKLYYTENDLCLRIQALNLKTVHLGTARVWHRVSASTDKAGWRQISNVYAADAKAYYLKYHSWLTAQILFLSLKLNHFLIRGRATWPWLGLVLLSTWLRFYRLPETMTFIGDQGRDYLSAKDMALTGVWPLTGIPSSIPWLHQGPLFIWATALFLKIGNFNPLTPAIFTAVLGVLTVYLLYRLSRSWWAGLILATAPLSIIHSRLPYHLSPIPLVTVGYLWALTVSSIPWAIFFSSLLLQFELSNLPLIFLTLFWFRRDLIKLIRWAPVGLIPFAPKIIYDFSHGFSQTLGLAAWTGVRLFRFEQYGNATGNIFEYWTKFSAWGFPALAILLGLWIIFSLPRQPKVLVLSLIFLLTGFYIHGAPSEGYFLVLFPIWAWLLASVSRWRWGKLGLAILVLFNVINIVKHDFYTYGPSLSQRLELVDRLPDKIQLQNFPANPQWASYLDNYRYLLWWRGKDFEAKEGKVYSIFDGTASGFVQPLWTTVYHWPNQKLIKYDY
ncbi:MAG: glycosyltransferase [Candidatus Beckwithbacteria bacterium]|nr:glycosyltransferase [Candidatus Beckwithbacteria bacterium]